MDFSQFIIEALRMGGRVEIHGPGSTEEEEHGEADEEGEAEGETEGSEEADDNATGYNRRRTPSTAGMRPVLPARG